MQSQPFPSKIQLDDPQPPLGNTAMRGLSLAIFAICFSPFGASAVVIDDFNTGPASSAPFSALYPGVSQLKVRQEGLPTNSVIGGVRETFFLHGGDSAVGQNDGVLRLNYDQSLFEVAILDYSRSTAVPPLNANLVPNGETHLLFRVQQATYGAAVVGPAMLMLGLQSGEGSPSSVSKFLQVPLIGSNNPYTIAIPLGDFVGVNLTDVDQIYASFKLYNRYLELEIDEIVTESRTAGDLSTDGIVDPLDHTTFSGLYGAGGYLAADANGDRVVDAADYTVWRDAMSAAPAVAVPEASALALVGMAVLSGSRRPFAR